MAEVALTFAVEKLGDLLMEKVDSLQGVEGQVKWLKGELETMQCFLQDAAEKQANQQTIRKWISDIRDLAQDAEDIIETFILKVDNPRRSRGLLEKWACFPGHVYHLDMVGEQIKSIRARLEDLDQSRQRYDIQNLGEGNINMVVSRRSQDVESRRILSPWQKDKHVVGLEEDVELLLKKAVLEKREGLSVATIIGMGGSGKSTLARIVYNHAAIAEQFDRRAWVCVSSEIRPKEIIKELVLQLVEPDQHLELLQIMENTPLTHAKRMLYERLQGKRYFIVVDDVWEDAHWEALASAFPDDEENASRLLLTSRNGISKNYTRYVHEMKLLDEDQSWELFLKKAFVNNNNNGSKCPDDLEDIGREILKRCDGLPLAITVVGGLLAKQKKSKSEWEKVLRGMTSLSTRSSEHSVLAILELSYNNLPPHLKSCFLCLGFFKEDAVISANQLVQVWIAQGLIQQGAGEETMEEIGTIYLDELINRNMVQVKDMTKDRDSVKTCHIHDLLRELSIMKANEEISFQIVRKKGNSDPSLDKIRHCAIYDYKHEKLFNSKNQNKHIRSLFMYEPWLVDYGPSYWKSFKLLRVLNIEGICIMKLPYAIGDLIGLRYLGLRSVLIRGSFKLPSSIGRLKNLQVLAVREGVKVPNVIWKLDRLRHLYMDIEPRNARLKLDTLKNLQTLSCIRMSRLTPEHLKKMTSLRKLSLKLKKETELSSKLLISLATLENLVYLKLFTCFWGCIPSLSGLSVLHRITRLKLEGSMTTLPSASNFPPNLSYLTLVDTYLSEDPFPVLEKLPKLLYLKLQREAYSGEEMVISHDGFPNLQLLSLCWTKKVRNIQVGNGAMPQLKRLEIYGCPALKSNLPEELSLMADFQE